MRELLVANTAERALSPESPERQPQVPEIGLDGEARDPAELVPELRSALRKKERVIDNLQSKVSMRIQEKMEFAEAIREREKRLGRLENNLNSLQTSVEILQPSTSRLMEMFGYSVPAVGADVSCIEWLAALEMTCGKLSEKLSAATKAQA